jgi:predicted transcriptional regulator
MDIQTIVKDLLETGISATAVSKLVGCAPHTITRYANGDRGKRPSYELANKLKSLHKSLCKKRPRRDLDAIATSPP